MTEERLDWIERWARGITLGPLADFMEVVESYRKLRVEHAALFIELTKAKDQIEHLEEKLKNLAALPSRARKH
jgi:allophanate hydrolase subunit 1